MNNKNKDIEEEDLGDEVIQKPYDPDKIRIDHQNVNLGFLLEKLEYKEIDLMPDFQREADLWSLKQKSQLIESVLLGLPLPSFYFSVDPKSDKWQVVDGLQRLSTFQEFWVKKDLKLEGLEFLDRYEKKKYNDLSRADLRKISGFKVNLYVIEKDTPKEVKFLIFKRVNTGGLVLTPQEMRHALNQGIPAEFVKELAQLEVFKKATDYKISSKRQEDRDFVNRFLAFYLLGYQENYLGELNVFLNDGMAKLDALSVEERKALKEAFECSMKTCFSIFGEDAFRKRYSREDKRKPLNKSLYDSISVNIAWCTTEQQQMLIKRKVVLQKKLITAMNDEMPYQGFHKAISTGTGQRSNVVKRFETIRLMLKEVLE